MARTARLADGRALAAEQASPVGDWVVFFVGDEDRAVKGRWLLAVVSDLLGLPDGKKPDWVYELLDQLSGFDTPAGRRFACPCCDLLTLDRPPTGTFQTCPVCWWEDDNVQYKDPDYEGGANRVSLREARDNFRSEGASRPDRKGRTRPPLEDEMP
jgi:hypothetical protein